MAIQTCDQPHSAARPTVPIATPASAPKLIGRSGGRAAQYARRRPRPAAPRRCRAGSGGWSRRTAADQQRQRAADRDVDEQAADRAAAARPDPRRDQADAGRQHDQHRLAGRARNWGTPKSNSPWKVESATRKAPASDDLAEAGPAGGAGRPAGLALLVALGVQRPGAEHRERGAADQHQVGRAPERHVLAEDAVPDVVEREGEQRARAADRDHQGADRRVPGRARARSEVRVGRFGERRGRSRPRAARRRGRRG